MSHKDMFRQVPWSIKQCCIALGVIVIFRVAFYLLSLVDNSASIFSSAVLLWLLMFAWMAIFPMWIARCKGMLRRPKFGLILKELGLAIPLVLCLLLVENIIVVILSNMTGDSFQVGSVFSEMRGAPNDARLYLLLIPMFTFGPVAEELFFRGLLYNALRQRTKPIIAMILQAIVFALVHYGWPDTQITRLLIVFVSGVVLAGVYEWRKSIWSPIALHILKNFAFVAIVIMSMILNSHTPAKTWAEAKQPPEWLEMNIADIEKKAAGEEQRLYAINTWGSYGQRLWKKEIRALQTVCEWFPDDREACSKACMGIAQIYTSYLRDHRRAVIEIDNILAEYKDFSETCAQALILKGWAYYDLGDNENSKKSFQEVIDSYASYSEVKEEALHGLRTLDSK
ncbi:MAG: CPBP family intramembrane metalloprotease [Planctomycetes bacterium]|nr:CPBP family intramembrane metalloprotease [Planctomycetota bacterium]